jgi:hypothetical protein
MMQLVIHTALMPPFTDTVRPVIFAAPRKKRIERRRLSLL